MRNSRAAHRFQTGSHRNRQPHDRYDTALGRHVVQGGVARRTRRSSHSSSMRRSSAAMLPAGGAMGAGQHGREYRASGTRENRATAAGIPGSLSCATMAGSRPSRPPDRSGAGVIASPRCFAIVASNLTTTQTVEFRIHGEMKTCELEIWLNSPSDPPGGISFLVFSHYSGGKRPAWLFWLGFQSSARRLGIASCGGVKRGGNALYPDWARWRWIPAFVAAIKIDTLVCIGASLPSC